MPKNVLNKKTFVITILSLGAVLIFSNIPHVKAFFFGSEGDISFWNRVGTVLSPRTIGDTINVFGATIGTLEGILKGTAGEVSVATAGVDYIASEADPLSWLSASIQTGLTGNKSGTFDLSTTGDGRFDGGLGVGAAASSSVGLTATLAGAKTGISYTNSAVGDGAAGYGANNTITASGLGALGYGTRNTITANNEFVSQGYGLYNAITASGRWAAGYGVSNIIAVSGNGSTSYGIKNEITSSGANNNQTLWGESTYLEPNGTGVLAYGNNIFSTINTINNPTVNQIGLYIDWAIAGTDTLNKKWAIYNSSADTTAGKVFLGKDSTKTYWGTGYDASIYYNGTDLIIDPKEVGTGAVNLNGGNLTTSGTLGAGAITGTTLTATAVGGLTLGTDVAGGDPNIAGSLKLFSAGDNAFSTTFTAGAQSADVAYTLPVAYPISVPQVLQSTTGGTLSWVTAGGALTPWTSDIDADGFSLNDANIGTFNNLYLPSSLGAEKITAGTTFASGWTYDDTDWSLVGGVMQKDAAGVGTLYQTSANMVTPLVIGETYTLTFILATNNGYGLNVSCGGVTLPADGVTAAGTYTFEFTATSTADLIFTPSDTRLRCNLTSVSLKRKLGTIDAGKIYLGTDGLHIASFDENGNQDFGAARLYIETGTHYPTLDLGSGYGGGGAIDSQIFMGGIRAIYTSSGNLHIAGATNYLILDSSTSTFSIGNIHNLGYNAIDMGVAENVGINTPWIYSTYSFIDILSNSIGGYQSIYFNPGMGTGVQQLGDSNNKYGYGYGAGYSGGSVNNIVFASQIGLPMTIGTVTVTDVSVYDYAAGYAGDGEVWGFQVRGYKEHPVFGRLYSPPANSLTVSDSGGVPYRISISWDAVLMSDGSSPDGYIIGRLTNPPNTWSYYLDAGDVLSYIDNNTGWTAQDFNSLTGTQSMNIDMSLPVVGSGSFDGDLSVGGIYSAQGSAGVTDTYDDGTDTTITFTGGIATGISTAYDEKLLKDIKNIGNVLPYINDLRVATYKWNEKGLTQFTEQQRADQADLVIMGFIGQDFQKHFSDLVSLDGEYVTYNRNYLNGIMMKAIQELNLEMQKLQIQVGLTPDGGATLKEIAVDKVTAKVARLGKMEMVDSATGDIYCTWIENGEWQKIKGECAVAEVEVDQPIPTPEMTPTPTPEITPTPEATPEVRPEVTPTPETAPETQPEITPTPEVTPEVISQPEVQPQLEVEPELIPLVDEGEPSNLLKKAIKSAEKLTSYFVNPSKNLFLAGLLDKAKKPFETIWIYLNPVEPAKEFGNFIRLLWEKIF